MMLRRWKKYLYDGSSEYSQMSFLGRFVRVLVLSAELFRHGGHARQATVLTYYTLFSLVPLAALLFGIAKGFALEERLMSFFNTRFAAHQETLSWIYRFAETTLQEARGGVVAGVGVIFLFGTVITLASGIEDAFNTIWHLPQRRNLLRRVSDYLAILLVTPIVIIIAGSTTVVTRTLLHALAKQNPALFWKGLPLLVTGFELIPLLMACLLFGLIYFFVPNTRVRLSSSASAAFVAGTMFQALQCMLIYLQVALARYNTIYGSFAAVPLLLLFLQWSWKIILFGAEFAFVHQNIAAGHFAGAQTELSSRTRRLHLLTIAGRVIRQYDSKKGGLSESAATDGLRITRLQAREYLTQLRNAGVLLRVADAAGAESFVPAMPAANLTIMQVWKMLDESGENRQAADDAAVNSGIADACGRLESAAAADASNRPLGDF